MASEIIPASMSGIDLSFGMGSPQKTSGFVQSHVVVRASSGGGVELIGEHRFSVRDQGPAEVARTISGKAPLRPKMALATIQFSGSIGTADH